MPIVSVSEPFNIPALGGNPAPGGASKLIDLTDVNAGSSNPGAVLTELTPVGGVRRFGMQATGLAGVQNAINEIYVSNATVPNGILYHASLTDGVLIWDGVNTDTNADLVPDAAFYGIGFPIPADNSALNLLINVESDDYYLGVSNYNGIGLPVFSDLNFMNVNIPLRVVVKTDSLTMNFESGGESIPTGLTINPDGFSYFWVFVLPTTPEHQFSINAQLINNATGLLAEALSDIYEINNKLKPLSYSGFVDNPDYNNLLTVRIDDGQLLNNAIFSIFATGFINANSGNAFAELRLDKQSGGLISSVQTGNIAVPAGGLAVAFSGLATFLDGYLYVSGSVAVGTVCHALNAVLQIPSGDAAFISVNCVSDNGTLQRYAYTVNAIN